MPDDLPPRHPATTQILAHFSYMHLPPFLQAVSKPICDLAFDMTLRLCDGPELTVGLRKLLEAKDALVRQGVMDMKAQERQAQLRDTTS